MAAYLVAAGLVVVLGDAVARNAGIRRFCSRLGLLGVPLVKLALRLWMTVAERGLHELDGALAVAKLGIDV